MLRKVCWDSQERGLLTVEESSELIPPQWGGKGHFFLCSSKDSVGDDKD